ncbi:Uncharacterized protein BP5553_06783 [Venustampulla echinocandica]|uniref:Ysc84 actin-binding domain-containing protein n=1 Tax=Venustampulla echinocandica TaxID=2656787 RepID=A0A370TKW5_9HELO|nr:Uncharacterized protein BP5553_06783 [Venustampulla echinocandica]RDL36171.1 Uncharacterized protein BP5553_06783 [Venustampulla echinocandica]
MQRVTSMLPSWDKTKTGSKKGFDKAWGWADKLGAPINKFSNKIGSEAFWPTTLDIESDKAARILRSFCKDGFYAEPDQPGAVGVPKGKQRVPLKIPQKVIQNAVGLAIFTTMRTGLWISGAGGSGVLIGRQADGEWSPPSGIMLHTAGLGFLVGVDIYDCVLVINNRKALESFTKIRATIGGEISAVAGPVGAGGILENDGKWKQANRPVFTYMKSRGFYAGVQVDGTVIIERTDENERFYGERIGATDIIAGKARHPPYEIKKLMETVKAAEGRTDVDKDILEDLEYQPAPGDVDIVSPAMASGPTFGVPEPHDPDPFGVLALEKAGLEIREAGTKSRPPSSQFEYNPSPTSPVFAKFNRRSIDGTSNRASYMSGRSVRTTTSTDRYVQMSEAGTQTDELLTPNTSPSHSDEDKRIVKEDEPVAVEAPEVDYTKIDLGPFNHLNRSQDFDGTTINDSPREQYGSEHISISVHSSSVSDDEDEDDEDEDEDEEPVIFEAASAQATVLTPQSIKARGGLITIKRPAPPPLPPRSIARRSRLPMIDHSAGPSPLKSEFEEVDLYGADRKNVDQERDIVPEGLAGPDDAPSVPKDQAVDEKGENTPKESDSNKSISDTGSPAAMDDLEKLQTAQVVLDAPVAGEKVDDGHLDASSAKISPIITNALSEDVPTHNSPDHSLELATPDNKPADVPQQESLQTTQQAGTSESKSDLSETDDFHSVPTTPAEVK